MSDIVRVCTLVCALLFEIVRAAATEPITIGFGMALTGNIAANGRAALIAMKLWEEDINKAGGLLGRPVKLIYYDDQSTPPNVPGLYTKLLDLDKVDIVVSGYGTNMTVPAMPVVMAHDRMFMTLFALGVNADFKYSRFFGMLPTGPTAGAKRAFSKGFFETARAMNPPPKTLAIVGADAEASRNLIDGAQENAKEIGLEVVYNRSYPPTTNDFSPIVRAIQATHPDVVFVASYPSDSVGMVNALHEIGLKARLVGGGMVGLQTASIKTQLLAVGQDWEMKPSPDPPVVKPLALRLSPRHTASEIVGVNSPGAQKVARAGALLRPSARSDRERRELFGLDAALIRVPSSHQGAWRAGAARSHLARR
jgi:ABC-type branched-subunit amino acid transport system substrate-binding protein